MFAFKNMNVPILVATDVASRGLDIKSIKVVVNYQARYCCCSFVVRLLCLVVNSLVFNFSNVVDFH
jgi:superfamily II DNA/RNA helicase